MKYLYYFLGILAVLLGLLTTSGVAVVGIAEIIMGILIVIIAAKHKINWIDHLAIVIFIIGFILDYMSPLPCTNQPGYDMICDGRVVGKVLSGTILSIIVLLISLFKKPKQIQ